MARDFRAQNRLDFQQNPSNALRNVNAPHENNKALRHIINSLINSYKLSLYFTWILKMLKANIFKQRAIFP